MPPEPPPPPAQKEWTIKALLDWTGDYLKHKGIDSARAEAQMLLASVLNCKKVDLIVRYHEVPSEVERTRYRELIQRRIAGWPVAYLVGSRDFYLLSFEVTPDVLIPRPETETLVLEALAFLKTRSTPSVLDLGTGSGCIAVSIAHQLCIAQKKRDVSVVAVDQSPDALKVAERNAARHGVAERIRFLQGDLFTPLPPDFIFDLVVSNPPYIAQPEFATLAPDVREHEPRLALDGGPDGLVFYRRIAASVGPFLKPGGRLLLEIGYTQDEAVRQIVAAREELELLPTLKDLSGHARVIQASRRV